MDKATIFICVFQFVIVILIGIIVVRIQKRKQKKCEQFVSQANLSVGVFTFRPRAIAIVSAFFGLLNILPLLLFSIYVHEITLSLICLPFFALGIFLLFKTIRHWKTTITIQEDGLYFPFVVPKKTNSIHTLSWVKEPTRIKWEEIKSLKQFKDSRLTVIETIHDKIYTYPINWCPITAAAIFDAYLLNKQKTIEIISDLEEGDSLFF